MTSERSTSPGEEKATLGGGCFWCLEAVFQEVPGVRRVESGYAGGHAPDPDYRRVCAGETGHAEVVQVTFDPTEVSYRRLLELFFAIHDPTQRDRQGPDVGTQYRSIILHHDEGQRRTAEDVIDDLEARAVFEDAIVTEVAPLRAFHPAEPEHQDYYRRNPGLPYCRVMITPKLAKLRGELLSRRPG